MEKIKNISPGNHVYYEIRTEKGFSDIHLCTIDHQDIKNFEEDPVKFNERHKPIPISEKWHNRFGVEKNGFDSFEYELPRKVNIRVKVVFTDDYVYLRQSNDGISLNDSLITIWNKDVAGRYIYVHEWQNLYNSLTGEKLKKK